MKLETLSYRRSKWSVEKFPAMDGPNTLVLVFGAPSFLDHPDPIKDLAAAYPQSIMIGCSTAGEIFDERVLDESLSVAVLSFEHTKLVRADAIADSVAKSLEAGM